MSDQQTFKLFVGGIPYSMTSDQVKELFADGGKFNVVSVYLPVDRMNNNRPRGFGFVEFETHEDAQAAMEKFNGFEVEGRKLKVNEARPKEEGGRNQF